MFPLHEHLENGSCEHCEDKEECALCGNYYDDSDLFDVELYETEEGFRNTIDVCDDCYVCSDPDCKAAFDADDDDPAVYYEKVVVDGNTRNSAGLYHQGCIKACDGPCNRVVAVGPSTRVAVARGGTTQEPRYQRAHPFFALTLYADAAGEDHLKCDDCLKLDEKK